MARTRRLKPALETQACGTAVAKLLKEVSLAGDGRFHEANLSSTPIRDLRLTIAGTPLEPVLAEFRGELARAGVARAAAFYLSTEWGVPFGTIAIAIPFYLARPDLTALHAEHGGHVEGAGRADVLRYLRHEMGHVVNYAYRAVRAARLDRHFGAIDRPTSRSTAPQPFSRHFVRHLPGWYAQKHPDEDWAETFAVWMTPGLDWRADYADWPAALAKLEYCDRTMARTARPRPAGHGRRSRRGRRRADHSLEEFYRRHAADASEFPPGLDGALRAIFEDARPRRRTAPPGGGADPPAGAATDGQRLPLDRPLPERTRSCCATWRGAPTRWGWSTPAAARPQAAVA